jgi:hypothetical protein
VDRDPVEGDRVRLLAAARTGLVVGFAITRPVTVWLGPQLLGRSAERADVPAALAAALRALWVGQGVAIAFAGPRAVGPGAVARLLGMGVLVAVPLPLVATAWLAHAAGGRALGRGIALAVAWAAAVAALAGAVDATRLGSEPRRTALAALEVGLAAAVWALRQRWLGWIAA